MNETDKGFEVFYKNLSNRRKFIRTIWIMLIGILVFTFVLLTVEDKGFVLVLGILSLFVGIWQLFTTYHKWKNEDKRL
ncbi:MAG: hypothetical protein PHE06_02085 [Lachnospiraceae bacterium]|nr:hypothetical protein [Lachnospiraceae bacterium]